MKILLIGNGGREHALAEKIISSSSFKNNKSILYSEPGNPGIDEISSSVNINFSDLNSLSEFALKEKIDLTVVGPEVPLSLGIVDKFREKELLIFGPTQKAAEIESSKIFSKGLMQKYRIPSAEFKTFETSDLNIVKPFIEKINYPVVIKADGLAAGKGVVIANNLTEVEETIDELCNNKVFGDSGTSYVIEKFLEGNEVSLFIITDGDDYILLPSSQDHKRINDNDEGKNTGGMGAYSPTSKFFTDEIRKKTEDKIVKPVLDALKKEGRKFNGCLYAGLMIDKNNEPIVIEFNCRFGDPETQCVMEMLDGDILQLFKACAEENLRDYKKEKALNIRKGYSVCVVLSSGGYPEEFEKNKQISGLDRIDKDIKIFYSGVKKVNSELYTNSGRVLSLVSYSKVSLEYAIRKVYLNVEKVSFDGMHYRKDIGRKGI